MTDSQFEEDENWSVSDVHYRGTRSASNKVGLAISRDPKVRRRRILQRVLDCIVVRDPTDEQLGRIEKLCAEIVDLDNEIELIARRLIDQNGCSY